MKNCLLGLILKRETSVLSSFVFLKNDFGHRAAGGKVRILLFLKIMKIQTSPNSLKYAFYGQIYHSLEDFLFN